MSKLVVLFQGPAFNHWGPRFAASGLEVESRPSPVIGDTGFAELPPSEEDVVFLVNARVAAAYKATGGYRNDIYSLPVAAVQDDSPVGLDFLVKV